MVFVQICVGSSCHLKGAPDLIAMIEESVAEGKLQDDIVLSGSFCTGKCNRIGVTITVDDEVCVGITRENFRDFWEKKVMARIRAERGAL